jgi:excisionase family DNA binding protein
MRPTSANSAAPIPGRFDSWLDTGDENNMSAHQLTEPLLDANEAARLLQVPRSTLYELVRSRGLPHIKVGRALRFTRADLGYWITENSYGCRAARR